jgi:hypothetical protein
MPEYEKTLPDFFEEFFEAPFGGERIPQLPRDRKGLLKFARALGEHLRRFEYPTREDPYEIRPGVFTANITFQEDYTIGQSYNNDPQKHMAEVKKALLFSDRVFIDIQGFIGAISSAVDNREYGIENMFNLYQVDEHITQLAKIHLLLRHKIVLPINWSYQIPNFTEQSFIFCEIATCLKIFLQPWNDVYLASIIKN